MTKKPSLNAAMAAVVEHCRAHPDDALVTINTVLMEVFQHADDPTDGTPDKVYILSLNDGETFTNAPFRPGESVNIMPRLRAMMKGPHALLVSDHALAVVNTENALARGSDSPDAGTQAAVVQLLDIASHAFEDIPDGVVDIALDTQDEIQAAMMLEMRGKGTVVRTNKNKGEVVVDDEGRQTTVRDPNVPSDVETIWRITRKDSAVDDPE